jgi:hypothetical protein
MNLEERVAEIERVLEHRVRMDKLNQSAQNLRESQLDRLAAEQETTSKVLPKLEKAMKELEEATVITAAQSSRHEDRIKQHQAWMEQMEVAFARMAKQQETFEATMDDYLTKIAASHLLTEESLRQLDAKIKAWLDARGSNGHG